MAGNLNETDYRDYTRTLWLRQASAHIGWLEGLLKQHARSPAYWAEDVETAIETLTNYTVNGRSWIPDDYLVSGAGSAEDREKACREGKRAIRLFGSFLEWWPVIRSTAGMMKNEGIRPARVVGP